MKYTYKSFEDLPAMLSADQLAQALSISRSGAYQLMHADDFPTVRIGKRMLVPKKNLCDWVDSQVQTRK